MATDQASASCNSQSLIHRAILLLGLILAMSWIGAQAGESARVQTTWQQLTPMQKEALGPLQPEWDRFNADRKRKWLNIASRYSAMSPDQRATLHHRMAEWVGMTPQQRRLARENFLATGKAPLDSRKEAWERYQKLPAAEKRKLAREARTPPQAPGSVSRYGAEERHKHPPKAKPSSPPPHASAPTVKLATPAARPSTIPANKPSE